jgi:hypothetical protein
MRLLGKVISSTFLRSDLSWHENAIVISPLSWFVPINLMQIRLLGALAPFFAGKEL